MSQPVGRWIVRALTRTPIHLVVVGFLLHFAGARLASVWDFDGQDIVPLWPAVGLVVGFTLLTGNRWWIVLVGAALGDIASIWIFSSDSTLRFTAVVVSAQFFQNSIAAYLGQRLIAPPEASRHAVRTIRRVLFGTLLASAFGGAYVALLGDFDERFVVARNWLVGDSLGYVIGAPVVYSLTLDWIGGAKKRWILEFAVSIGLVVAVTVIGFNITPPLGTLAVPGVAWLAVRFGPLASTPMVLFTACWATWRTSQGDGPFADLENPLVTSQYFTAAVALAGVFIAAQATQSDRQHRRLAGLLRTLPDAVFVVDDDGVIIEDYTRGPSGNGPLAGTRGHDLVEAESLHQFELSQAILRTSGRATTTTKHISARSGKVSWYETKLVRIGVNRSIAVGRDVSDRLAVDAELRTYAQRWRELMNASFQGIVEIDAQGFVTDVNTRFAASLGQTANDMLRHRLLDVVDGELWQGWNEDYHSLIEGKRVSQQIERENRTAIIALLPQLDAQGHFNGAFGISLDTT